MLVLCVLRFVYLKIELLRFAHLVAKKKEVQIVNLLSVVMRVIGCGVVKSHLPYPTRFMCNFGVLQFYLFCNLCKALGRKLQFGFAEIHVCLAIHRDEVNVCVRNLHTENYHRHSLALQVGFQ